MVVILPSMLDFRAHKHEVVSGEFLDTVAHDTARSLAVGHKVEFVFLMPVDGVVERGFVAVYKIKAVAVAERCYFSNRMVHFI